MALVYTEDELLLDHPDLAPHLVAGVRMHGGFRPDGSYQPPRALVREAALGAWQAALIERGGSLLDADASLLGGVRVSTTDQSRVLLRHGLGETFWNSLTITGKIEAKGRLLAEVQFPSLQPHIVDDITEMAIGHLGKGLLKAHGLDEGGEPGVGAHDAMWFAARDLAFGAGAYPDVDPPENIARPEAGKRFMPELPPQIEGMLSLLMNLLVIEFRAEIGFAASQELLRTPDLFVDRRPQAEEAAEIIERIRADEDIHVRSLRLYLGELAAVTFRTVDGGTVPGQELIDRFWGGLVRWAVVEQPKLAVQMERPVLQRRVMAHPDGAVIWAEYEAAA
ncbi:MAG: hypothetical protein ACOYMR_09505 [Ilumatobacteraceae bacterium]